ncbi:MAG: ABC transporter ATP-binding protein [Egibacteraceae bacterium]
MAAETDASPARAADRALVRRVARLFGPYRGRVAFVVVAILISSGIGVVNPLLIKVVFDNALFCGAGCPDLGLLGRLVALMVTLPVVAGAVGVYQTYQANLIGQRVMLDLRNRLYEHLQGLSLRFFTGTRTGEIQSRLANDVGGVQTVVTETASTILSNIVILLSTVVAMVLISWQLTVLSLFMTPVFLWFAKRVGEARRRISEETQSSLAEMSAITQETLSVSGVLLAKVFNRQRDEIDRYRAENDRLARLQIRREMVGRVFFALVGTFFSITPALIYLAAGWVDARGGVAITSGTVVAFTTLQTRLFFPVGQLLQVSVEVRSSLALFGRVFEYLDLPAEITEPEHPVMLDPERLRGHVALRDVFFSYGEAGNDGEQAWALQGVDLRVEPGQLGALVGPSGAGKTTISYLVPRLYDATRGSIELDGIDVRRLPLATLAGTIGMVTQESYLFHASVRDNLRYARPDATDDELEAAARTAAIHDRIMALSDGYDTTVGERGYRLSGGEKQRLAIARVILKDPRVLILDEATSALDTTSERLVQQALQPLMVERTTLAIAHRLSTILAADVIFVLDQGRVVERGTHDELLATGGLYAQLYDQQFSGGLVEARCEDGFVMASGRILHHEREADEAAREPAVG